MKPATASWPLLLLLAFSCCFILLAQPRPADAQTGTEIDATGRIPQQFRTYTFFLVCNPNWLATEKSSSLAKLYSSFKSFGRAIGKDNHSVWFWMGHSSLDSPELARNLDMKRNTHYCLAWRLKLTSGPYLVILSTRPDEKHLSQAFEKNHAIFDLGSMKGPMASDFLAKLADDLVQAYRVNSQAISPAYDAEWWYWWLEDARANLDSFSCSWSFKIDAGAAREELHSCGGK